VGQALLFNIGEDEFGIPVGNAVEVIRTRKVRKVPDVPDFVEGFVPVRRDVVPLINMKKRFDVQSAHPRERILVVRYAGERVGLLVDRVSGILKYEDASLLQPPSVFRGLKSKYLAGILERGGKTIVLLDISQVLSSQEKIALKRAKEKIIKEKEA